MTDSDSILPWWPFDSSEGVIDTWWKHIFFVPAVKFNNWLFLKCCMWHHWWHNTREWQFQLAVSKYLRFVTDYKRMQLMETSLRFKNKSRPWYVFRAVDIIGIQDIVVSDNDRNAFASINSCGCCYSLGIMTDRLVSPPPSVAPCCKIN